MLIIFYNVRFIQDAEDDIHKNEDNKECSEAVNLYEIRKSKLMSWINKYMKIEMTDGRILIGTFVCTDKDANVILSSCSELFNTESTLLIILFIIIKL